MNIILPIILSILLVIALFIFLVITIGYLLSCRPYKGPITNHFNGTKFINPSQRAANGFKEVGEYGRKRKPDRWTRVADPGHMTRAIPIPKPNSIQYTFINHSTFIIHVDGLNILTDPIWSERCSPFQFAGPRRMRPPGISFDNLPQIDLVILSHNHYDHLDKNTIKKIQKAYNPSYFVPLGLKSLMKKWGCKKVAELDWWQETSFQNLTITATPANHFSSRGIFDRDKTLWAGYIMQSPEKKIYYTGDTGYSDIFKEIGTKKGPFDLAFIPIGAYKPEWFMGPIHISPDEAVQVHHDVLSRHSVAMHFGTFPLADDNPERSTSRLRECLKDTEVSFLIPNEGHTYTLPTEILT